MLEGHGGDLSKVLKVGELKALILSRTGRIAKSKKGGAALCAEAEEALRRSTTTLLPDAEVAAEAASASGDGSCPSCGVERAAGALEPYENGNLWCNCGGRLPLNNGDDESDRL